MASETTTQRGEYFARTQSTVIAAATGKTDPIASKSATVQVSGAGSATVTLLRHPATESWNGRGTPPSPTSLHWADASPGEPITGNLSAGPIVGDFSASGMSWWMVRLDSGSNVTVFVSVGGEDE